MHSYYISIIKYVVMKKCLSRKVHEQNYEVVYSGGGGGDGGGGESACVCVSGGEGVYSVHPLRIVLCVTVQQQMVCGMWYAVCGVWYVVACIIVCLLL